MRIDRQTVNTGGTVTTIRQIVAARAEDSARHSALRLLLVVHCGVLELFTFGVVPFT